MASSAPRGLRSDHVVTVGIALFSMLFGAGNLIIPPLLALQAGSATPVAMLGFLIAAIGLPVMGFIAVALAGTARELAGRVHPKFGEFFVAAVYLAIGPCLAIPRTSSTAFEMLVPLLPEGVSLGTARLVFAIGFFVVAFVLTLRPGVITRVLGRITGPALIALIVLVVGAAVVSPLGPAAAPQAPYNAGAAVQGVVVTDGVNMTRTNKQGAYGLRTSSDKSKLVYLTVPSGYEVESTRGFIPRFYRRVTAPTSVEQVQRHDFTLKKVNNDRHIMIVLSLIHI